MPRNEAGEFVRLHNWTEHATGKDKAGNEVGKKPMHWETFDEDADDMVAGINECATKKELAELKEQLSAPTGVSGGADTGPAGNRDLLIPPAGPVTNYVTKEELSAFSEELTMKADASVTARSLASLSDRLDAIAAAPPQIITQPPEPPADVEKRIADLEDKLANLVIPEVQDLAPVIERIGSVESRVSDTETNLSTIAKMRDQKEEIPVAADDHGFDDGINDPLPGFLTAGRKKSSPPPLPPGPFDFNRVGPRLDRLESAIGTLGKLLDQIQKGRQPEYVPPLETPGERIRLALSEAFAAVSDNQIRYEAAFKARNGNSISQFNLKIEADEKGVTVEALAAQIMNDRALNEVKTIKLTAYGPRLVAEVDRADDQETALAQAIAEINTIVGG